MVYGQRKVRIIVCIYIFLFANSRLWEVFIKGTSKNIIIIIIIITINTSHLEVKGNITTPFYIAVLTKINPSS